jgi:hypothetical protein
MKRLLLIAVIVIGCVVGFMACGCSTSAHPTGTGAESEATSVNTGDVSLARAFTERAGDLGVEGQGTVSKLLTDDTDGARHQRFIVTLASGQTLLVTHNIDIAPRVGSLRVGDAVWFKGVYEWNAQGGLIHWTHRDPTESHEAGWIKHNGRTYQ